MLPTTRDHAPNALCPRCGYDQRGVIATWRDSCPLHTTCTECGLHYSCAEMLRPDKFEPRWCVEYCETGKRRFLRACVGTFARSFLPWRFWSRLQMSHRIRPRRIAAYIAMMVLPLLIIYIATQTTVALHARSNMQLELTGWYGTAQSIVAQPMPSDLDAIEALFVRDYSAEWVDRMKESQPDHWTVLVESRRLYHEQMTAWAAGVVAEPPKVQGSAALAVAEAILLPLSESSMVTMTNPTAVGEPYPAPASHWMELIGSIAMRHARRGIWVDTDGWLQAVLAALWLMAFGALVALLFPLSLALLPMSRRKAKVRWAHIARITAYGTFIPITAVLLTTFMIAAELLRLWSAGAVGSLATPLMLIAIGFIPTGTTLWWLFAINRHLKMPHALAVTATLMLVCFLAAIAIVCYAMPERLFPTA